MALKEADLQKKKKGKSMPKKMGKKKYKK